MQQQDDRQPQEDQPLTLAEVFAQPEEGPITEPSARKRPVIYRSYMGGDCLNCGEPLGLIETEGGRDRHFCDNNGKCRVAYHRKQEKAKKRQQILQYNVELREYWSVHQIKGRLLTMLQEILLQHGKQAARAATDAVIVAQLENEHRVINMRQALIIDLFDLGEEVKFAALVDVDVPGTLEGWSWFADNAPIERLQAAITNAQRIKAAQLLLPPPPSSQHPRRSEKRRK